MRQVPEAALAGAEIVGAGGLIEGCSAVLSNNPAAVVGLACAAQATGCPFPPTCPCSPSGSRSAVDGRGESFSELSVDREAMGAAAGSLLLARLRGEPIRLSVGGSVPALLRDRGSTARFQS